MLSRQYVSSELFSATMRRSKVGNPPPAVKHLSDIRKYPTRRLQQGIGFSIGSDRNAQVIPHCGVIEPAHQDSFLSQFLQPLFCAQRRRTREDKIGLAWQDLKSQLAQFTAQPFPGRNDPAE